MGKRAFLLAGAGAAMSLAALLLTWPNDNAQRSLPSTPAPAAPPTRPVVPSADSAGPPDNASVSPANLHVACATLAEGDLYRGWTQECLDALAARFLPQPVSRSVLPVSPPMTWRDVFGELAQDIADNIEAVDAALADEVCAVPEGEVRPEFASRCAARDMAELHVLREVCRRTQPDWHFSLSPPGFDLESLRMAGWARLEREPYATNIDGEVRAKALARWAEDAPDQQAYVAGEERLQELYHRTAWKRARCEASRDMLDWMRGERWRGLLARAARLGDEFALAHRLATTSPPVSESRPRREAHRREALRLLEHNPAPALLQLASLDIQDAQHAWKEEDAAAGARILEESLDGSIRLLAMAGIDCGDPCDAEAVDALEHRLRRRLAACNKEKCPKLQQMLTLQADLERPYAEKYRTRDARSLPHRKHAEAIALKYAFAVESLAQNAGVPVDASLLGRMADPHHPQLLSAEEVEQARFEAARLVAELESERARLPARGS